MSQDELHETLARLHETLGDTTELDDESRQLLLTLMKDITLLLNNEASDDEGAESLSDQIIDRLSEFDIEHPILSGLIQRLSDGLANMGI